ncbi:MAG: DNA-binding protein [Chitinophagaceae bacterium]|nr:DNA-binding protein [Chitinophagaceae bacterium]
MKKGEGKAKHFPVKLAKPAQRALEAAGITTLKQLARFTEEGVRGLHGIGEDALKKLKAGMRAERISFKSGTK